MYKFDTAVTPLNFKLDLEELKQYYNTIQTDYKDKLWTWNTNLIHVDDVAKAAFVDPAQTSMRGWPLQSDMADPTIPPSVLKSRHPSVPWYNTELMFGIPKRLQDLIPHSYRWTLFVLPPGGKVPKHSDLGEYVIHIPIQWNENAVFVLGDEPNTQSYTLPADGTAYLVDVEIPHETANNSNEDRVGLIFRIKREYVNEVFAVIGNI